MARLIGIGGGTEEPVSAGGAQNGCYGISMRLNVAHVMPPAGAETPFKQAGR
jgi:hypothetical protein